MEVKNLKDFYIDLDGDIKASTTNTKKSIFITETTKPNSEYIIADNIEQIKDSVSKINSEFKLDFDFYRQYSVKTDKNGDVVSIKIWGDSNEVINGVNVILIGYEIGYNDVIRDYYFTGSIDSVKNIINENNLNYEIKEFDTHKHFLYSIKYDQSNSVLNFKTYYIVNDNAIYYTNEMIPHLKTMLRFF